MNIGIIVNPTDKKQTGIGYYGTNLLRNLKKTKTKDNKYILLKNLGSTVPKRIILGSLKLPRIVRNQSLDIVHDLTQAPPFLFDTKSKKVVTVHDLTRKIFPEFHSTTGNFVNKITLKSNFKKADKIIADSNNTKKDLIQHFQIKPQKITVIYGAANKNFKPIKNRKILNKVEKKYYLPQQFILYVGTLEPRKNIVRLLKAYASVSEKIKINLVIAGKKGWKYTEIFETYHKLKLNDKVIFTGYLERQDLPAIYNLAKLFVYPSLYEGFGLPPLEAMACGCPVITSNTSSLPEVVGSAGIMINPYSVDGLTNTIKQILINKDLRKILTKKGLKQAKKFSWEKAARETLKVYEKLMNKS